MAHPYQQHRGKHHSRARVHKVFGGSVGKKPPQHDDEAADKALFKKLIHQHELKTHGSKSKPRMDKYARGGKVKHGGKGHHTKINIVVAPKGGGADVPPPPMAGPPVGGPSMAGPPAAPMVPKVPMKPPAGPMGGGMPIGMPPGGMKRGGGVKPRNGIASSENLKDWANYASKNTRYERGGKVPMKAGADSGEGRLQKIKAYGKNAKRG